MIDYKHVYQLEKRQAKWTDATKLDKSKQIGYCPRGFAGETSKSWQAHNVAKLHTSAWMRAETFPNIHEENFNFFHGQLYIISLFYLELIQAFRWGTKKPSKLSWLVHIFIHVSIILSQSYTNLVKTHTLFKYEKCTIWILIFGRSRNVACVCFNVT